MKERLKKSTIFNSPLEQLGWYCTGLFLLAYFLVTSGILASNSIAYQLLNILGAVGYAYYAHRRKVYPSLLANTVWALIGMVSLVVILF